MQQKIHKFIHEKKKQLASTKYVGSQKNETFPYRNHIDYQSENSDSFLQTWTFQDDFGGNFISVMESQQMHQSCKWNTIFCTVVTNFVCLRGLFRGRWSSRLIWTLKHNLEKKINNIYYCIYACYIDIIGLSTYTTRWYQRI